MTHEEFEQRSKRMLEAWNSHDADAVVARYTPDVVYLDPNTRGAIEGADGFRRYLTKLFERWQMHWELTEAFLFGDEDGGAFLWRATLQPRDGDREVTVEGMDLVVMDGELVKRNEVYFDRAALAELFASPQPARA